MEENPFFLITSDRAWVLKTTQWCQSPYNFWVKSTALLLYYHGGIKSCLNLAGQGPSSKCVKPSHVICLLSYVRTGCLFSWWEFGLSWVPGHRCYIPTCSWVPINYEYEMPIHRCCKSNFVCFPRLDNNQADGSLTQPSQILRTGCGSYTTNRSEAPLKLYRIIG